VSHYARCACRHYLQRAPGATQHFHQRRGCRAVDKTAVAVATMTGTRCTSMDI
jgi:hypothetical protein